MVGFDIASKFIMADTVQWWECEETCPFATTFTTLISKFVSVGNAG